MRAVYTFPLYMVVVMVLLRAQYGHYVWLETCSSVPLPTIPLRQEPVLSSFLSPTPPSATSSFQDIPPNRLSVFFHSYVHFNMYLSVHHLTLSHPSLSLPHPSLPLTLSLSFPKVWDTTSFKCMNTLTGHDGIVLALCALG